VGVVVEGVVALAALEEDPGTQQGHDTLGDTSELFSGSLVWLVA